MTEQPKSKLMARLREQRARLGLVRVSVDVWVKRDAAKAVRDKLRKYAARLASGSSEGRK